MQQYFSDEPLVVGEPYIFTKEQAHHAKDVLRMHHERVRLVYDGIGYFADAYNSDQGFIGDVLEKDERINELSVDVTLAIGELHKRDNFELILQKATELGVKTIVPFESSRTVAKMKKDKQEKVLNRRRSIVLAASEQCKRNVVPVVTETVKLKKVMDLEADTKLAPYENAFGTSKFISESIKGKSILVVVGPEGGFSMQEMEEFEKHGFEAVTLGNRILRAETACMYAMSVIGECCK